ncbi:MAG: tetratricopeptide repeat protein [Alphaproteobacteria bacterium]|nr:tetratricopeptide repeat protein [Alphaproteobacteria bacterium]
MQKIRHLVLGLALGMALGLAAPAVTAMGAGSDPAPASRAAPADPDFAAGKQAVDARDWPTAIRHLDLAAAKDPGNADIQNYLGYAYRNSGDLQKALAAYDQALKLDPKHRGAHEYLGEAYLLQNDLPKAEEMLARLDKLCFFGCAEYTELKNKIAAYKARKSS